MISMAGSKWSQWKEKRHESWTKSWQQRGKPFGSGKNTSRIYIETLQKSPINLLKKNLVLFNSISTAEGYLIPKDIFVEEQLWYPLPRDKEFHAFPQKRSDFFMIEYRCEITPFVQFHISV